MIGTGGSAVEVTAEGGLAVWVINVTDYNLSLPLIPTEGLLPLTLALLGLGGMRTAEKFKGKARNNMKN